MYHHHHLLNYKINKVTNNEEKKTNLKPPFECEAHLGY